jgi:uncharacterized membrane protein (DUF485 family)
LDKSFGLVRELPFGNDGLDGAFGAALIAVDAFVGINEQHPLALTKTVAGAVRARYTFAMTNFNSRVGLMLFTMYLLLYGGFVYLAAFSPQTMEATPFAGVNLAIWYGFGLIGAAFVLAMIYGCACGLAGRHGKDQGNRAAGDES